MEKKPYLSWQDYAQLLSESLARFKAQDAIVKAQAAAVKSGLETIHKMARFLEREKTFIPAESGTWYHFFKMDDGESRLFLLSEPTRPQYYMERIALEHFCVNVDRHGSLTSVVDVNVTGMKNDHQTGYPSLYMRRLTTSDLVASPYTMRRLEKYIAVANVALGISAA